MRLAYPSEFLPVNLRTHLIFRAAHIPMHFWMHEDNFASTGVFSPWSFSLKGVLVA